ncbi:hypothetical protein [Novosphingobium sp. KN65.2]|uniref:hypothetical protein n=1 Tax=Novosphingobium sp. KN65.2 TaxID=1478134 RepID=UPI0005E6A8A6|nr:hypothetical protein [Novosphingobium sp. KN65.2]CDO37616.1 exported hypothetical protein [Novosphingobium sp. KN65.2]
MRLGLVMGVASATLLSASAGAQTMRVEVSPQPGVEATVAPGEQVYSYAKIYAISGARTDAASKPAGWFGLGAQDIPAGTKLVPVQTSAQFKACVPYDGTFEPKGPCFLDDDGDGNFDRTTLDPQKLATKLKAPLPYSSTDLEVEREDSLRRVILYQGATSDSLRFSYREFHFDLARPAFTEELTVPREQFPAMVRIKNMQIEVMAVTGLGLRYRVVSIAP